MSYKFYTTSEKAWEGMYQAIQKAEKSIYLEMYIFNNDTKIDFFSLFKEKAQKGVKIKIILDSLGSVDFKKEFIEDLRSNNIEVLFMSHFLHRMHKKVLIVDEKIAFLGGVNIHQSAIDWDDLAVSFVGKKKIQYLISLFAKDYSLIGGEDIYLLNKKKSKFFAKIKNKFFNHFPAFNLFRLKKLYKDFLFSAQKEVLLVTPYFVPRRYLVGYLDQCILRGVSVTVLLPEKTDAKLFDKANIFYMQKYKNLGINFELSPKMNHAKLLFVDGSSVLLGSQNFDFLSFDLNAEIGMFIKDKEALRELESIVSLWRKEARTFDIKKDKLSKIDMLIFKILDFFVSLL